MQRARQSYCPVLGVLLHLTLSGCAGQSDPNTPPGIIPRADPGGPYSAAEGESISFDGSGSGDQTGTPLRYHWEFGDGHIGDGVAPSHTYLDDGIYTATLVVTTLGIKSEPVSIEVVVTNLPPIVTAGPAAALLPGWTYTLRAAFHDPGDGDGPWRWEVDWGDGSPRTSGSVTRQANDSIVAHHHFETGGRYHVVVTIWDKDGGIGADTVTILVAGAELSGPITLVGAGDIARCGRPQVDETARLLDRIPGFVITLGDNVYPDGRAEYFQTCFEPTWGRHKDRTFPALGNHDYVGRSADAYFDYWGERAGPRGRGYYSYDLGSWHIIVLNSEIDVTPNSPQVRWLRADLAANDRPCILAYWHYPLFFTYSTSNSAPRLRPLWEELYNAGADIILNGHVHHYERFAPQNPRGEADPVRGIRQFIVGTGGAGRSIKVAGSAPAPQSEVWNEEIYGVLQLTLEPAGYGWEFVTTEGSTVTDSGRGRCQ